MARGAEGHEQGVEAGWGLSCRDMGSHVRGSGGRVSDIHLTAVCKAPASCPGCSENPAGGGAQEGQSRVKDAPRAGRLTPASLPGGAGGMKQPLTTMGSERRGGGAGDGELQWGTGPS